MESIRATKPGKRRCGRRFVPRLGLVCQTLSKELRFRTITRTRYLALSQAGRKSKLRELYADNLERLFAALEFCRSRDIHLYRAPSGLFPMSDEPLGEAVLRESTTRLSQFGPLAEAYDIRVVQHPDQYVVLSSINPKVVAQSKRILDKHALAFDLLGLPRSSYATIILHGGKAGRAEELLRTIDALPPGVRGRLTLENDEYAYSSSEILAICRRAGLPMVFDAHHHIVKEKLDSYDHAGVAEMVAAARETWPDPAWQLVHLSNGLNAFDDPRHSDLIETVPGAYEAVPWIEVEAKGKEEAIVDLRRRWPGAE